MAIIKKEKFITVRFSKQEAGKISKAADSRKVSRSQLVRQVMTDFLQHLSDTKRSK